MDVEKVTKALIAALYTIQELADKLEDALQENSDLKNELASVHASQVPRTSL